MFNILTGYKQMWVEAIERTIEQDEYGDCETCNLCRVALEPSKHFTENYVKGNCRVCIFTPYAKTLDMIGSVYYMACCAVLIGHFNIKLGEPKEAIFVREILKGILEWVKGGCK